MTIHFQAGSAYPFLHGILVNCCREMIRDSHRALEKLTLNADSLTTLCAAGVPAPVLSKLDKLANKVFSNPQHLMSHLADVLDNVEYERFAKLIVNHASVKGSLKSLSEHDKSQDSETEADDVDECIWLRGLIQRLPEDQRMVLELYLTPNDNGSGKTFQDIGNRLGIGKQLVHYRYGCALKSLRSLICSDEAKRQKRCTDRK